MCCRPRLLQMDLGSSVKFKVKGFSMYFSSPPCSLCLSHTPSLFLLLLPKNTAISFHSLLFINDRCSGMTPTKQVKYGSWYSVSSTLSRPFLQTFTLHPPQRPNKHANKRTINANTSPLLLRALLIRRMLAPLPRGDDLIKHYKLWRNGYEVQNHKMRGNTSSNRWYDTRLKHTVK